VAAAAAVVIVLTLSGNWSARGPEQPLATSRQHDIDLAAEKLKDAPAVVPIAQATVSKPPIRRATAPPRQEPEILIDPAITVRENGVAMVIAPVAIARPGGSVVKVRTTVFGCRTRDVVSLSPTESVTVRISSRYDG